MPPQMPITRTVRLAALLAPIGLAACSGSKAPTLYCPQVAVLQQASRMVLSRGESEDVASRTLDARITGVAGSCSVAGKGMERVTFRIGFAATNGPASRVDRRTLGYFIAITQGERIVSKKIYPVVFAFEHGADQAVATTAPIRLDFPRAGRSAAQQVLVGFQMSQAALERSEAAPAP